MNDIKRGTKVTDGKGIYTVLDSTDFNGYDFNKPSIGWELVDDGTKHVWKPVHNGMYTIVA